MLDSLTETANEQSDRDFDRPRTYIIGSADLRRLIVIMLVYAVILAIGATIYEKAFGSPEPQKIAIVEPSAQPFFELKGYLMKDADTLEAHINVGFGIQLLNQDLRARDYDAWESHKYRRSAAVDGAVTDEEVKKGQLATTKLREWIGGSRVFVQCDNKRDTYGRWLVSFHRLNDDGTFTNFATWMKRNGHTRPTP